MMSEENPEGNPCAPLLRGAVLALALLIAAQPARAGDEPAAGRAVGAETASLPVVPDLPGQIRLPAVLGDGDAERYRAILLLQEKGQWAAADRHIRNLEDKALLGHVLAQRYLHPTHYRSRFSELATWLRQYADHPQARQIHALALQRKPANAATPPGPRGRFEHSSAHIEVTPERAPGRMRPGEDRVYWRIAGYVKHEHLTRAEQVLAQESMRRAIGTQGVDRVSALVAAGWFRRGDDVNAYRVATAAARRSGVLAPRALWWAGLSAFRLGKYDEAVGYLEKLADIPGQSDRDEAAAAFWAARAALRGGRPEKVGPLLDHAARFDRTFYGHLAAEVRGRPARFDWDPPAVTGADIDAFAALQAGRRTLALIQIGEEDRAERELRSLRVGAPPQLLRTVMALADGADMPGAALRAGRVLLRATGERVDTALYPLPHWVPEGGFSMDRALIYALARQESGFDVRAKSHSGARGLMQLMPATARFIADGGQKFVGRGRNQLYDPHLNLHLGQKYLDHLLGERVVSGNLVKMIAAYNGGPGNLTKWKRRLEHDMDPLAFIESIPARETRLFVKRVLENLWAYRSRLGQDAPSRTALAAGLWPSYEGLDGASFGVAEERSE